MSVKIFDTMTTATPNFPLAYAEKINIVKEGGTEDNLQNLFDNGELGGDSSLTITEAEYLALSEEEKSNNSYYLYDVGVHYKDGIAYSRKEPIPLTMEEYKALKEADAIDPKQEYLIEAGAEGILLNAEDVGYDNAASGIQVATVQGAIDKVVEKVDGKIDDSSTNTTSTWSSSKIASSIVGTKTQYRGSRSIDINTGGRLTLIYSSEYASQAGCYMLLSNFNTEPLLIELGRTNIGQFRVTATHKTQSVDTITVTAAGDEYSWYVLQF